MPRADDVADIKALLIARMPELAAHLAPDGRREGRYWIARNPTRDDKHRGSFWITIGGPLAGAWKDAATDDRGDALSLPGYILKLDSFPAVLAWARAWLGLDGLAPQEVERRRHEARQAREKAEKQAADELARNRRRAFAIWLKGSADLADTPVATYLAGRGIDLAALARPPRALRSGRRVHRDTGRELPAMLAAMTGPDETMWALHTTWLREDGSGKADVEPARKIWPSFSGACIRLAKGETGLAPRAAAAQGLLDTLALCEGVEDGLSIALACPDLRVWAAGSLANLGNVRLPECCAEVIVAADNDWGKPGAEAQLAKALTVLASQGRPVKVARSPIGKDFNDALRGVA